MPRRPRYAYLVELVPRRGPVIVAALIGLVGLLAGFELGLGFLAAAALAAAAGGATYAAINRP